ncbi:AAA family ATPase [Cyanobium sp. Alchichica 3B3-8F6]|nr:AAA family ATPase [Cyanobium sp. Alchichica 3B3-8F6]
MAEMIPDSVLSAAPRGEKFLFNAFRDALPDNFIAWHEPSATTSKPDFVILSDTHGLLVVEAKGWSRGMIKEADSNQALVEWPATSASPAREQVHTHPLKQAESYKYALMDKLKAESILVNNQQGVNYGKLSFPMGRCAIMTGMTRSEIEQEDLFGTNLAPVFLQESILFADDIESWSDLSDRQVIAQFWELFDSRAKFRFPPLTDDQIQTIRAVLNPSTSVKRVPATPQSWNLPGPVPEDATIIKTLDLQQERAAKQLGDGHRILSGVAGSGKTLILTARAKWLLEGNPDQRVLITCFNVTLAAYIRSVVHGGKRVVAKLCSPGVEARHFHGWAKAICGSLPQYGSRDEDDVDEELATLVMEKLEARPELRYDAILVDEAHIMHPSWFKALKASLKEPDEGSLLIVNDASQKLRKRKRFSWASVGINARGRTRIYKKNYRNTREILACAWSTLSTLVASEPEAEEAFPVVIPDQSDRHGGTPKLILAKSVSSVEQLALGACKQEIASGVEAKSIALIYRYGGGKFSDRIQRLLTQSARQLNGEALYWVTRDATTRSSYGINQPGIRLITTQSALGLEFKSVYLLWLEDFDRALDTANLEQQLRDLRELYVAMTRAQDHLTLICSSTSRLGAHLAQERDTLGLEVIHA